MKGKMRRTVIFLFAVSILILFLSFVYAAPTTNDLHVNIQTTDSGGNVIIGTFDFVFNISTSSGCETPNVIYTNSTTLTTDSRGIISYYLPNVNLSYDEQYWLCYYRNGSLIEAIRMTRMPYAFRAQNVTLSGVEVNQNFNLSDYNLTNVNTGFFTWLGSLANRITKLFVIDVNATGTINAASFVGDGSGVSNVVASSLGDIGCTADKYLQWSGSSWVCANMPSSGSNVYVNLIPEGTVAAFNRTICPEGWIPANGTNSTPDLRGIFVRGAGTSGVLQDAAGNWFSAAYGTYQDDQFQSHRHNLEVTNKGASGSSLRITTEGAQSPDYIQGPTTYDSGTPRVGAETRPANIALLYCVKVAESSPETGNLFDISGNLIYVKDISHSLGVGIQVPNARLEVNGTFSVKNSTGTQGLYQDAQGMVGIGTTSPSEKLEVNGGIKIVDGNQGANKVLTSDASGVGSWQTAAAVPSGAILMFNSSCPTGYTRVTALDDKFPRGSTSYGSTGGSDDAIVVSHSHTFTGTGGNTGTVSNDHQHIGGAHFTSQITKDWGYDLPGDAGYATEYRTAGGHQRAYTSGITANHYHGFTPAGTISTTGSSGTGANVPAYVTVVFCMKN